MNDHNFASLDNALKITPDKTTFLLKFALAMAKRHFPVVYFCPSEKLSQVAARLLLIESGVDSRRLQSNRLSKKQWEDISTSLKTLAKLPFYIDDTASVSIADILTRIDALPSKLNPGLVIIEMSGRHVIM